MAQVNAPKAFDKQSIDPGILKQIEPLIDWSNQNTDQIIRALFNQLTLAENFRGRQIAVSAMHGQPATVDLAGQALLAAVPLKSDGAPLRSLTQSRDTSGRLVITPYFDAAIPVRTRSVSVSAPLATYEIPSSQVIEVGDKVSISQYGNKANNGTFVVQARTASAITVINALAAAEAKTDYSGTSESAKTVTLFLFFV